MRWASRAWFTGVWWLFPGALAIGIWFESTQYPRLDGYPLASVVKGAQGTTLTFGLVAAAAALVAARLRRSGLLRRPATRARLRIVVDALLPVLLAGAAATVVTTIWVMQRNGALGWPGMGVPTVYASMLIASACWGFALGRWLRGWIAASAALIGTYVVLGFPPALEPYWLRHMFGVTDMCCSVGQVIDPRVVWASTLVALGSTTAALLAVGSAQAGPARWGDMASGESLRTALAVLLTQVVAWTAGACVVQGMDATPATARIGHVECRQIDATRVCVWPEHVNTVPEYVPFLRAIHKIETREGLPPTTLFTEVRDGSPSSAVLYAAPAQNDARRLENVLLALNPDTTGCLDASGQPISMSPTDIPAILALRAWWLPRLTEELKLPIPSGEQLAPQLERLSENQQARWVGTATKALRTCQHPDPPSAP